MGLREVPSEVKELIERRSLARSYYDESEMTTYNIEPVMKLLFQMTYSYMNNPVKIRIVNALRRAGYNYRCAFEVEPSRTKTLCWIAVSLNDETVFSGMTYKESAISKVSYSLTDFVNKSINSDDEFFALINMQIVIMKDLSKGYIEDIQVSPFNIINVFFKDKLNYINHVLHIENLEELFDEDNPSLVQAGNTLIHLEQYQQSTGTDDLLVPWFLSKHLINLNGRYAPLTNFSEYMPNYKNKYSFQRGILTDATIYSQSIVFYVLYKNEDGYRRPILMHLYDTESGDDKFNVFDEAIDDVWELYTDLIVSTLG